jgi:hypothetical protein
VLAKRVEAAVTAWAAVFATTATISTTAVTTAAALSARSAAAQWCAALKSYGLPCEHCSTATMAVQQRLCSV